MEYLFPYLFSSMFSFIIPIIFLFAYLSLRGRVSTLEKRVEELAQGNRITVTEKNSEATVRNISDYNEDTEDINEDESVDSDMSEPNPFLEWLKEDWLLKLGAFLMIIGFGWLASYALPLIGPVGRIVSGLILGIIIMVIGFARIKSYVNQGGIFIVLGSVAILLTLFADQKLAYGVFNKEMAVFTMFLSTVFVALAGVIYKSKPLAVLSLVMASVVPLLVASANPDYIGLFFYLLLVIVSTLWVVAITGWRILTFLSVLCMIFYSIPLWTGALVANSDKLVLLFLVFCFSTVFFIANVVGALRLTDEKEELSINVWSSILNAGFIASWVMTFVEKDLRAVTLIVLAGLFVTISFIIFNFSKRMLPFFAHGLIGLAYLGIATAELLDGPALTIAFILESVIAVIIVMFVTRKFKITENASFLLIIPVALSLPSIVSSSWNASVFHQDFAVLFLMMTALFLLGFITNAAENSFGDDWKDSRLAQVFLGVGGMYAATLLWLTLHTALRPDISAATFISLTVYIIVGLIFYFIGKTSNKETQTKIGAFIIALVIIRLLTIDVWTLSLVARIVTFLFVGALVMTTAFFKPAK